MNNAKKKKKKRGTIENETGRQKESRRNKPTGGSPERAGE